MFPSITFIFQGISFSTLEVHVSWSRFRRQLNWVVSLPLRKIWHNSLSSIQRPGSKRKGGRAIPEHVSAWVAVLYPFYTRHSNCITEHPALKRCPGDGANANKSTAKDLSGKSKTLIALGFNLSWWLMAIPLKENSYPTPFQAVFFVIFKY